MCVFTGMHRHRNTCTHTDGRTYAAYTYTDPQVHIIFHPSGIIFFASASCMTAYLAAWQTQRYFWKKEVFCGGKFSSTKMSVVAI